MEGYTEHEWQQVVEGPMIAGFAITAADPSSFVGALQESIETGRAMNEAMRDQGATSLIGSVVQSYRDSSVRSSARETIRELSKGGDMAASTQAAITRLSAIASLVRDRSPAEAEDYIGWLQTLAERVAEAGTEGGFLGFGGEKVSDAERRTLAEIRTALQPTGG